MAGIPAFYSNFLFWFYSDFKLNFLIQSLFPFGYGYYASALMVASQLNRQIILLMKRPLSLYWSPLLKESTVEEWLDYQSQWFPNDSLWLVESQVILDLRLSILNVIIARDAVNRDTLAFIGQTMHAHIGAGSGGGGGGGRGGSCPPNIFFGGNEFLPPPPPNVPPDR